MLIRTAILALGAIALIAATPPPRLDWAFPGAGKDGPRPAATTIRLLPGSPHQFTQAELENRDHAPDWYPDEHPPAPAPVLDHAGGACGFCHLPTGAGRSENAQLRGQPVEYIEEQVHAFASGLRQSPVPYGATGYMVAAARAVSEDDLRAAAIYFSSLEPVRHARVIEARTIPRAVPEGFLYRFDPSAREPLGNRIIEGPTDFEQHRLRDPHEVTIAYVPIGSIARGETLARHGGPGFPACTSCHTAHFVGIGGSSPSFIARQLAGFRARTRNDPGAAPMQAVAATLTDDQITDLAAFIGSRPAWTRAQLNASMAKP